MPAVTQTSVDPSTRDVSYNAVVATVGPFLVSFPLFEGIGDDLQVLVNGVTIPRAGNWTFSATPPEPSFPGAVNTWTGGMVTFLTARQGAVRIVGRRSPRRESARQFIEGRGTPARTLNASINEVVAVQQEFRRDLDLLDPAGLVSALASVNAALAAVNAITNPISLPNGSDLNAVISRGTYVVFNPVNGPNAGYWNVEVFANSVDPDSVLQRANLIEGGISLVSTQRRKTFSGVWEGWVSGSSGGSNSAGVSMVDASAFGVNPGASDIGPLLQAVYDANPGKMIAIPYFPAKLNWITPVSADISNTSLHLCLNTYERPVGTFLKRAMIEVRKRVPGGAKLDNVSITMQGRPTFLFNWVQYAQITPVAGSTFIALASPAGSQFDFLIVRKRGASDVPLSQSSDLTPACGPTGFTLATPSLAGDVYDVFVVPGDARTCAILVEGITPDRVGTVTLGDYDVEGFCYVANCLVHYDEVHAGHIRTYGCIDRGGLYPYLSGGKLVANHIAAYGKMRRFPIMNAYNGGAGIAACAYAFNVNPLAGQIIDDIQINQLHSEDMNGHAVGIGGDVRRCKIDSLTSINPGFSHVIGFGGTVEPRDTKINNATLEGACVGEGVYLLGGNTTIDCEMRGSSQVRIGGTGIQKFNNKVTAKILDPTLSNSLTVQEQTDLEMSVRVIGGPAGATTSASLLNLVRPKGSIAVSHNSNAGDAILLNNVDDGLLSLSASGKSRAALMFGNSVGNAIEVNARGCTTTGMETTAGSNDNKISGVVKGPSFPLLNNGTGNNVAALVV